MHREDRKKRVRCCDDHHCSTKTVTNASLVLDTSIAHAQAASIDQTELHQSDMIKKGQYGYINPQQLAKTRAIVGLRRK